MSDVEDPAIVAARAFVRHVVNRVLEVPEVHWHFARGSRSYELLVEAAAALFPDTAKEQLEARINAAPCSRPGRRG